jgi:hypothetical protein
LAVNKVLGKYGKIMLEATGHEMEERHLWLARNIFWWHTKNINFIQCTHKLTHPYTIKILFS